MANLLSGDVEVLWAGAAQNGSVGRGSPDVVLYRSLDIAIARIA